MSPPSQSSSPGTQLADLMREAFVPPLIAALNDVVGNLRKVMLERLDALGVERTPYIEGILQLRERHELIMAGFQRELDLAWGTGVDAAHDNRHFGSVALAENAHADDMELVGEDELEVRLATGHFADAIAREWKPTLLSLNGYLAWLDSKLRIDAASGPHSPQRVAMAVYGAFSASRLPGKVRALAIDASQREFVELMGPIYESFHATLVRHVGPQDDSSPRTRRLMEIPTSDLEVPLDEPDWLARFFVSWENEDGPASSSEAILPPELQQMLEQTRKDRSRATASLDAPHVHGETLGHGELVAALTLLQIASQETHEAILNAPDGLASGIKTQIVAQAMKLGTAGPGASPSDADANVLDLIGMLFEVIFKESHLTRAQRLTLSQLIAPMAKVALEDRRLFLQASHPARRLLNALVEASEGNTGETEEQRALLDKVNDVVKQLVANFDESQSVFRAARSDFMDFYCRYQDAAEQAETVAAETLRLDEAYAQALSEARSSLGERLSGVYLPAALREAVESGWPAHAARMVLAKRPRSAAMLLDGFVQAVEDVGSGNGGGNGWASAVDWLQPVWMGGGGGAEAAAEIKQALLTSLLLEEASAACTEPDPKTATNTNDDTTSDTITSDSTTSDSTTKDEAPAREQETETAFLHPDERKRGLVHQDRITAAYFRELELGSWLDFVDKNNRVQPGKFSWMSPVSSRLMFVNRGGARICVVSVEELVMMSCLGRVRMHRDEDAFYSAMQVVVDKLALNA